MFHFGMHLCSFALHSKNVCKYKYLYFPNSYFMRTFPIDGSSNIPNGKDAVNSIEVYNIYR